MCKSSGVLGIVDVSRQTTAEASNTQPQPPSRALKSEERLRIIAFASVIGGALDCRIVKNCQELMATSSVRCKVLAV